MLGSVQECTGARKVRFTKICSVQIWCEKVQTRRKTARMHAQVVASDGIGGGDGYVGKCCSIAGDSHGGDGSVGLKHTLYL